MLRKSTRWTRRTRERMDGLKSLVKVLDSSGKQLKAGAYRDFKGIRCGQGVSAWGVQAAAWLQEKGHAVSGWCSCGAPCKGRSETARVWQKCFSGHWSNVIRCGPPSTIRTITGLPTHIQTTGQMERGTLGAIATHTRIISSPRVIRKPARMARLGYKNNMWQAKKRLR